MRQAILSFLVILTVVSCELYEQDEYQEYYVVESYLVASDELPQVRLSKTTPINESYNFNEAAVSNANVEIQLLDSDSNEVESYSYFEWTGSENRPGVYLSSSDITVQPERLYRLHVTHNGNEISSTTYVPGTFETVNEDELQDHYIYQSGNQVEIETTTSRYITDRQTYYIFTVNTADTSEALTPFYLDLVKNQDADIEEFYINSSGIINEENYERENGTITLRVPWLSIAFFGENFVIANAIDDNMYDFLRSQDVQTGGTTLSPGEIQNIEYNVSGGIGIFGSMASDTNRVEIVPEDN